METVTFYSYKGGVGRTTLLAQCARELARQGARVVAVDFDLDAPGLHYRLRPESGEVTRGAVDLIDDYLTQGSLYASLDDATYLARTGAPLSGGWVRVLPAGAAPSASYWDQLSRIDWRAFLYAPDATGPTFLQDLLEQLRVQYDPDLVLIDSRTGITELSHAALSLLADRVVCVLVDNDENLDGARAVLHGVSARRLREEEVAMPLHVVVSRTDPTLPWSAREARIRDALEATTGPASAAPLKIASVHELPHEPALARADRLDLALHHTPWGGESALVRGMSSLAELLLSEPVRGRVRSREHEDEATLFQGAVWSYGQFTMSFGELEVEGLYVGGGRAYAVCPGLANAPEGTRVAAYERFNAARAMLAPITLVSAAPADTLRRADPSLDDLVELRDFPFNNRQLLTELDLRLPRNFPDFWGGADPPRFQIAVARALSATERTNLGQVFASFGYGRWLRLETRVHEPLGTSPPPFRHGGDGDIELITSRWLPRTFSAASRRLLEADESLWMTRRRDVYAGAVQDPRELLPDAARMPGFRGILDATVFPHPGAADLLALCDQLVVALPLADRTDVQLAAMGLDVAALVELARERHVLLLLPQSLDRYDPSIINALAEAAPGSMVLSRALCAASIVALKRRFGQWFYPPFGARARHENLRRLAGNQPFVNQDKGTLPSFITSTKRAMERLRGRPDAEVIYRALLPAIRDHWPRCEALAHLYGAMAMMYSGFGTLTAQTLLSFLSKDLKVECTSIAPCLAWADVLGAALVPVDQPTPAYSERRLYEISLRILATFSGIRATAGAGESTVALATADRRTPGIRDHALAQSLRKQLASHSDNGTVARAAQAWEASLRATHPPDAVRPWTLRAPGTDADTADTSRALHAMLAEVSEDAVPPGDAPPLWMLTRD